MNRQTAESIEDEAAEWLARLDRHGDEPELQARFEEWLAGDTRREGALAQARAAWRLIDDHFGGESRTVENRDPEIERFPVSRERHTRRGFILGGGAAIAASLVMGLAFNWTSETYETRTGEIRRVPLADGSTVAINTETKLSVRLKEKERVVRLDHGEAFFQVAKDRARPFTVEAGRLRVRALGTAFSVREWGNGADILVSEGVVEAWTSGAEGNLIRIPAGKKAFIANNAGVFQRNDDPTQIERALAWRAGQIDLDGDPLVKAIAEFNRYNSRKIVLLDQSIANEPLYGIFRTDGPHSFAQAIHDGFGIAVDYSNPDEIRIGRPSS